jgi:hypothetical protein
MMGTQGVYEGYSKGTPAVVLAAGTTAPTAIDGSLGNTGRSRSTPRVPFLYLEDPFLILAYPFLILAYPFLYLEYPFRVRRRRSLRSSDS